MRTKRRNTLDTLIERANGRAEIAVITVLDEDPDLSWLGEYSDYREPWTADQKLYHIDSGLILDHHGIWRNQFGWIQAAPEETRAHHEYEYIWLNNGQDRLKYAMRDAKRLLDYGNGWDYVGIIAEVSLGGAVIGHASVWGVESDSGDSYLMSEAREIAHEALSDARKWRDANTGKRIKAA